MIRPALQNQTWAAPEQLWISCLLAVVFHILLLGINGLQPDDAANDYYFPLEKMSDVAEGESPEAAALGLVNRAEQGRDQAAELMAQAENGLQAAAGVSQREVEQQWMASATANKEVTQVLLAREAPIKVFYRRGHDQQLGEQEHQATPVPPAEAAQQATHLAADNRLLSVGAGSREDAAVQYVESWRRWMRANGNLFYPAEARRLGLRGEVLTRVRLNSDGSLADVRILDSSGQRLLEQAVLQTTREARWFLPFPAELAQQYDQLEFSWRWRYGSSS